MSGTTLIIITILSITLYAITKLFEKKVKEQNKYIKSLKNVNKKLISESDENEEAEKLYQEFMNNKDNHTMDEFLEKKDIEDRKKQDLKNKKEEIKIKQENEYFSKLKSERENKKKIKRKMTNQEKKDKGDRYEIFLEQYFLELGYKVDPRGQRLGKKDGGIDLIIKKDNIYTLIQCKNNAPTTPVSQRTARMFNGDCMQFIKNNSKKFNEQNTKFLFIIPYEQSLNKVTKEYFLDNNNKCKYEIIEIE